MSHLEEMQNFLRFHSPCRVRDLEAAGFRRQDLRYLLNKGRIERLSRGIYQIAGAPQLEFPSYAEIFLRSSQAVMCLLTALHFHGLTTQLPHQIWIALPATARAPKMDFPPLRVVRFSGNVYTVGIETHRVDGIPLRVYSVAKTVADLFKMRNKVGLDVAMEALREAIRSGKATRAAILKMAKVCRVERVMRPYIEMEAVS